MRFSHALNGVFFFSSRRRHTRFDCDWSSDVCSSDLTFENYTRNTMDISAIPVVKKLSHLPIVADPSHGTGRRDKVAPMARAALAAGEIGRASCRERV